jgi:hypothetical protein
MITQKEEAQHHLKPKTSRKLTCFFHFGTYLAGITIVGKTARHKKSARNVRDIAADGREDAEKLKRTTVLLPA